MKPTEELKVSDEKIKARQAQYDLSRETAKISALSFKNLDKYKYLTGEDLGYKPGPIENKRTEYSPLAQIITKAVKKDDKVNKTSKYSNDLYYDSVRNFNKYGLPNFNEISSVESKVDTLNNFYKDFIKLQGIKSKTHERKQNKMTVLNNASLLYDELISIFLKKYDQVFESKDKKWSLKHNHGGLKDLNYQPDQLVLPKWVKVSKERFNEILDTVTEA